MPTLTHQNLKALLHQRNTQPDTAANIDAQIQTDYVERHAVLVVDMCGFSRLTLKHGIIHFLAMIQQLEAIATPLVTDRQGVVFKQEADNVFAVFPSVDAAVNTSVELLKALAIANQTAGSDHALYASMGIGYGDLICIKHDDRICDVYGNEMNLASKLGEDLAEPGEIWLTPMAHQTIQTSTYTYAAHTLSVSKIDLTAYKLAQG